MMRSLSFLILLIVLAGPVLADGMSASDVYKQAEPSIMVLDVHAKDGNTIPARRS